MSEPYDVTSRADADLGLKRYCDRRGVETVVSDPDVVWWEGATVCPLCGWSGRSVVPIARGLTAPVVALECGGCGNRTLHPAD